jgi:hypothetical protein
VRARPGDGENHPDLNQSFVCMFRKRLAGHRRHSSHSWTWNFAVTRRLRLGHFMTVRAMQLRSTAFTNRTRAFSCTLVPAIVLTRTAVRETFPRHRKGHLREGSAPRLPRGYKFGERRKLLERPITLSRPSGWTFSPCISMSCVTARWPLLVG